MYKRDPDSLFSFTTGSTGEGYRCQNENKQLCVVKIVIIVNATADAQLLYCPDGNRIS